LDSRLTTLLCKIKIVAKPKEVKTGWFNSRRNRQVWQNLIRKAMVQKGSSANDDDDDDDEEQ
jgi:hypothetical protein